MRRHPRLSLRTPQALSYRRARSSNKDVMEDFFGKLGALYGRLNLIAKPMQVYNSDETGVTVVHKPSKVIAELGRHHVYSVSSAERGKTHTVLSCVSASGQVLPPFMVYPRKRPVPESMKEGAAPNTAFKTSANGWINAELYLEWFQFFIRNIPPSRPVLLLQDGHGSHVSIALIELARANDIHLLCLPSHTSHILQPLDVGVFKSFKAHFSKACRKYLGKHPGRCITADVLAALVGEAYLQSHSALNIISGFKKTGIYPLNPGEVSDRQLAPSEMFRPATVTFTPQQIALYQTRYDEGYDLEDPEYSAWLKIYHPKKVNTSPPTEVSVATSSMTDPQVDAATKTPPSATFTEERSCSPKKSLTTCSSDESVSIRSTSSSSYSTRSLRSTSEEVLDELLVLPQAEVRSKHKSKSSINKRAICITELEVLKELKDKEAAKLEKEQEKQSKKLEREAKKQERERAKEEKKLERERTRIRKEKEREEKNLGRHPRKTQSRNKLKDVEELVGNFEQLIVTHDSDDGECAGCGRSFTDECCWVCCDNCDKWYDIDCQNILKENIPEFFFCTNCR